MLAAPPAAGEVCLMLPETLIDAYSPQQIALRVERAGVAKARLPALQTVTLGILAGAPSSPLAPCTPPSS